jgi:hypothetical protein
MKVRQGADAHHGSRLGTLVHNAIPPVALRANRAPFGAGFAYPFVAQA